MSDGKTQAEKLLGAILPFAEEMLANYGEFHPFGAAMKPDEEIVSVAGFDGRELPPSNEIIDLLASSFREAAQREEYIATAIVYDVRVTPPGAVDPTDAVAAELEHCGGYAVTVFVPYQISNGAPEFGSLFATGGRRGIFGELH